MKAYLVKDKDELSATVVFAETAGKARALAMSTECCEDVDFCDIEVRRTPQLDKYYVDGKKEMDWFNPQDRIVLVKECGFVCDPDYLESEHCELCSAKDYCDQYFEMRSDNNAE